MKHTIIIILSLAIVSCTKDPSLEKYLASQQEFELKRNERKATAISNLISESSNKELQVKSKLETLNSLYEEAIEDVNKGEELRMVFDKFQKSSSNLSKYEYSDWQLTLIEAANSYEKLAGTIALTKAKTAIMENISMEIGATYWFDQLELMLVPKKEIISIDEYFEAEVIFAAFSSKSEEFMTIVLNDRDTIDINNGKGKVKISPKKKGKHKIKVKMYDKKGLDLSDDFILEKEITFQVQ
ncbi:hypothetical protein GCM10011506_38200 [Marivirga lumbricoides]|uniref:Gliding motility-associated protein GldM first immunoglobulin-like domain-containing protein n=1 Tax=Marivirga lumbricoides TaxID=1046115 RepID=A0ABQ1MXH5_9BACT|nr:hypothetical protein GCM10011506_38200 [Marivirga lumbricoides]